MTGVTTNSIDAVARARAAFPTGLLQPEGRQRFSVDALILAGFLVRDGIKSLLDLGCGAGAVGFAALLEKPSLHRVFGLDIDPPSVEAAKANARTLGLVDYHEVVVGDVRGVRSERPVEPESFDAVVFNPPYFDPERGRPAKGAAKAAARAEIQAKLGDFFDAAAFAVKNKGHIFCILPASRLGQALAAAEQVGLSPARIRCVRSKVDLDAFAALIHLRKSASPDLKIPPDLVLYEGDGDKTRFTRKALAEHPLLKGEGTKRNPRRRQKDAVVDDLTAGAAALLANRLSG